MKDRAIIEYICGAHWALEYETFRRMLAVVGRHAAGEKLNRERIDAELATARAGSRLDFATQTVVQNGVAVIPILGVLSKRSELVHDVSPGQGTSYERIGEQLARAIEDDAVNSIMLLVDSPGGDVDGLLELADRVFEARRTKPVNAHIADLGTSAAYVIASQASRLTADAAAVVGSLGIYSVIPDTEEFYARMGVRMLIARTSPVKGTAAPGIKVTDEQLAEVQRRVDERFSVLMETVRRGRGWDANAANAVADARVYVGQNALALGLIDSVATFSDLVPGRTGTGSGAKAMDVSEKKGETNAGTPALVDASGAPLVSTGGKPAGGALEQFQALRAAFPDEPDFVSAQFIKGNSVTEARAEYSIVLEERNKTLAAENERLRQQATAPIGATPVRTDAVAEAEHCGSAVQEWKELVARYRKSGMDSRDANSRAVRENPELHRAMLAEVNAGKDRELAEYALCASGE